MASFALVLLWVGVAGLFFLDRDPHFRGSKALWLPVAWLWIVGSRPVSVWLGAGPSAGGPGGELDATLNGSPLDALFYSLLQIFAVIVLLGRRRKTLAILGANRPIVNYFTFCLISLLWSPFPDVGAKRWIKSAGDLIMGLIILTDTDPIAALRKVFSRVGFVLMPASVYLIRYSYLGKGFDPEGLVTNIGVTGNKNTLGLITFILALGAFWNVRALHASKQVPNRRARLLAQLTFLAFCLTVLGMAHSATSQTCFVLGAGVMIVPGLRWVKRRPARVHQVILVTAAVAGIGMGLGIDEMIVHALGRNSNLTGRTEIWETVLPLARNPFIGAGFEMFWNSVSSTLRAFTGARGHLFGNLNSAHNGYIEVYLNLGLAGLALMIAILVTGYLRASAALRYSTDVGGLALAYVVTCAIYGITEAGFRMMTPTWFFLVLAVTFAGGIARGAIILEPPAPADLYPDAPEASQLRRTDRQTSSGWWEARPKSNPPAQLAAEL